MFKLLVALSALVALVSAGGSSDVDQALLARVAQILSENESSGGSSGGALDGELLARVSQIIDQNDAAAASRAFSPPVGNFGGNSGFQLGSPERSNSIAEFSSSSGGSSGGFGGRSSGIQIGAPERAQRIGEFSSSSGGFRASGGY